MSSPGDVSYVHPDIIDKTIGAWFLGPKFENHLVFEQQLRKIVTYFKHGRETYFPKDGNFITPDIIESNDYKASMDKLDQVIEFLSILLANHSVPFSSPRYAAHVSGDSSLPAVVGYILGMMYNQNNVSPEASPLTGAIEYVVGQDLCRMLGFKTMADVRDADEKIVGWGHITCDGSVANYESMWIARSLKYYPLSLFLAITEGQLQHVASEFYVKVTGKDTEKLFATCTPWELLNLKQDVILDLATRLTRQFCISNDFINEAIKPYLVQTIGKDKIERLFHIKAPKYFNSITKHYSINKGANILGIGEANLVDVDIDLDARMDPQDLKKKLLECIEEGNAIYAVLAIMGTTEHGAVDPVDEILKIRRELEASHGVSFLVHCDAAWGGYFASILRNAPSCPGGTTTIPPFGHKPLLPYTKRQLRAIEDADTVTVDSHKSGYVPYPAGGLCYRDGRMRYLITTTSPYINTTGEGVEAMGTFGLEGSKPGASPVAVWVSNMVLGLHMGGYGSLLSQAIFSGVRYYTLWSTVSDGSKSIYVVPFVRLPIEKDPRQTRRAIEEEKHRLMKRILERSYNDVSKDESALDDIQSIGSDLMINTFSCNFRLPNGELNTDVTEANFFNQRIYERLSIRRITDDINQKPVIVVGTVWEQAKYKACLTTFKERLGLDPTDPTDLHAYSSVAMSPFVVENLIEVVGAAFKKVAEEEAATCVDRMAVKPAHHGFVMQGTDSLYLVYLPMLHVGRHRQQLVLTGTLPKKVMEYYVKMREANPSRTFILHASKMVLLEDILKSGTCMVHFTQDLPDSFGPEQESESQSLVGSSVGFYTQLTNIKVVKHHSLVPRLLARQYPEKMLFYLYGTPEQQHVEHVLLRAPNAQLASSRVRLQNVSPTPSAGQLAKGLIAVLDNRYEATMQPFSEAHKPDFFKPGASFPVSLYTDPYTYSTATNIDVHDMWAKIQASTPIAKGTLVLGKEVYTDALHINQETLPQVVIVPHDSKSAPGSVPQDVTLKGLLSALGKIIDGPDVAHPHEIEEAVGSKKITVGNFQLIAADRAVESNASAAVAVSRYFMARPTDRNSATLSMRRDWQNAIGGFRLA